MVITVTTGARDKSKLKPSYNQCLSNHSNKQEEALETVSISLKINYDKWSKRMVMIRSIEECMAVQMVE